MTSDRKIVIFKGSPRPNGNSATLADQVADGARSAGASVESYMLHRMNIQPCDGCNTCESMIDGYCIIHDDMQILYPKLVAADAVLIASPVYWFNVSAQTKLLIDRFHALGSAGNSLLSGKQFGIALTYEDPDPYISGAINPIRSFQDMFRYLHIDFIGMVYGTARDIGDIQKKPDLLKQAFELGQKMAQG
jgi:multimeric flavodoxin WrbA